jgi:hypothetical protein
MVPDHDQGGLGPSPRRLEALQVTHGPTWKRLETPVEVMVPAPQSPAEEAV